MSPRNWFRSPIRPSARDGVLDLDRLRVLGRCVVDGFTARACELASMTHEPQRDRSVTGAVPIRLGSDVDYAQHALYRGQLPHGHDALRAEFHASGPID